MMMMTIGSYDSDNNGFSVETNVPVSQTLNIGKNTAVLHATDYEPFTINLNLAKTNDYNRVPRKALEEEVDERGRSRNHRHHQDLTTTRAWPQPSNPAAMQPGIHFASSDGSIDRNG